MFYPGFNSAMTPLLVSIAFILVVNCEIRKITKLSPSKGADKITLNDAEIWITGKDDGKVWHGEFTGRKILKWTEGNLNGTSIATVGTTYDSDTWAISKNDNALMYSNNSNGAWKRVSGLTENWEQLCYDGKRLWGLTANGRKLAYAIPNKNNTTVTMKIVKQYKNSKMIAVSSNCLYILSTDGKITYFEDPNSIQNWKSVSEKNIIISEKIEKIFANPTCETLGAIDGEGRLWTFDSRTKLWAKNDKSEEGPLRVAEGAVKTNTDIVVSDDTGKLYNIQIVPDSRNAPTSDNGQNWKDKKLRKAVEESKQLKRKADNDLAQRKMKRQRKNKDISIIGIKGP